MKFKNIKYDGKELKRINKQTVNKMISNKEYNGITIYMLPINANPDNEFMKFFELELDFQYMDFYDNMNYINEVTYYNCNDELGTYLKFYIEEK